MAAPLQNHIKFDGHSSTYYLHKSGTATGFSDALDLCKTIHSSGHLVDIESNSEFNFLLSKLLENQITDPVFVNSFGGQSKHDCLTLHPRFKVVSVNKDELNNSRPFICEVEQGRTDL